MIREFLESDYPTLERFWSFRGANAPPFDMLPKIGYVFESEGNVVATGFAYIDAAQSGCAWLGWTAVDPENPISGGRGLHHIVEHLQSLLAKFDYAVIFVSTANPSLVRFYRRRGFVVGDKNMTHLSKII